MVLIKYLVRAYVFLVGFLGFFLSSSALEVFKYGGARDEYAAFVSAPYIGVLNYVVYVWLLMCLVAFALFVISRNLKIAKRDISLVVFFTSLLLVPVLWSQYPGVSFNNAILLSALLVFSMVHVRLFGVDAAFYDISNVFFILLLTSFFLILFVPHYGIAVGWHSGSWQGLFSHKNNLGIASLLGFLLFISEKKSWVSILKISLSLTLLIGSRSYTSMAVGFFVFVFYIYFFVCLDGRGVQRFFWLLAGVYFSILGVFFISQLSLNFIFFGKGMDFSNRNLIWAFVLDLVSERPWLGYGLATFQEYSRENPSAVYDAVGGVVGTTHNGFIDSIFSFGVIGFFIPAFLIFFILKYNIFGIYKSSAFLFLVALVMCNGFESRLFSFNQFFLLMCYFLFSREYTRRCNL